MYRDTTAEPTGTPQPTTGEADQATDVSPANTTQRSLVVVVIVSVVGLVVAWRLNSTVLAVLIAPTAILAREDIEYRSMNVCMSGIAAVLAGVFALQTLTGDPIVEGIDQEFDWLTAFCVGATFATVIGVVEHRFEEVQSTGVTKNVRAWRQVGLWAVPATTMIAVACRAAGSGETTAANAVIAAGALASSFVAVGWVWLRVQRRRGRADPFGEGDLGIVPTVLLVGSSPTPEFWGEAWYTSSWTVLIAGVVALAWLKLDSFFNPDKDAVSAPGVACFATATVAAAAIRML